MMNPAALFEMYSRWEPIIKDMGKPVSQVSDEAMQNFAELIAGENSDILLEIFKSLKEKDPNMPLGKMLGSKAAGAAMKTWQTQLERPVEAVVQCPDCEFVFETTLKSAG